MPPTTSSRSPGSRSLIDSSSKRTLSARTFSGMRAHRARMPCSSACVTPKMSHAMSCPIMLEFYAVSHCSLATSRLDLLGKGDQRSASSEEFSFWRDD
jgi:hypothetical protein